MTAINTASSLADLTNTLNDLAESLSGTGIKLEDCIDLTSLPTFGGEEPHDTTGIFSWDEDQLLVTDGNRWYTIDRYTSADRYARKSAAFFNAACSISPVPGYWIAKDVEYDDTLHLTCIAPGCIEQDGRPATASGLAQLTKLGREFLRAHKDFPGSR